MSQPPPMPYDLPEEVPVAQPVRYTATLRDDSVWSPPLPRPGIVTAIGVSSLVVAVLQAGAAMVIAFMGFALWVASIAPGPGDYDTPAAEVENHPDGLPIHLAAPLTNRFAETAKLSPKRRESLDALLRHSGQDITPTVANAREVTAADAKRLLISYSKTKEGNDALIVPAGRIELSDTDASFEPTGTTEIVTVETADMSLMKVAPAAPTAPATPSTPPAGSATPQPKITLHGWQFLAWYGASFASGMLSILLLVAGILALRGNRGGRKAHLWWAWAKLPIAIFGAIGVGSMVYEWAVAGAQANGTAPAGSVAAGVMWGCVQGALSVAYIAAVIVVMNLKNVRDYFAKQ